MGTTAQKLEYLGTTKSQLKDMINYGLPTDEQITSSTTFRNYVKSIFKAFLESLNNPDTLFTNLPKKNGTGTQITLNDTANAPMRIELGSSALEQETTTGKNLFNYIDNLRDDYRGLTSVINADGSITTTGIPLYNYTSIIAYDITSFLENGQTYTLSQKTLQKLYLQINITDNGGGATQYVSLNNSTSATFTADTDNKTYVLNLQTSTTTNWGDSSLTITNFYQLEKGNTATSFEKYTGGIPAPNPSFPQDIHTISGSNTIKVFSKQLFDKDSPNIVNGYLNANGTISSNNSYRVSDYIDVGNYSEITISGNAGDSEVYCFYKEDKTLNGANSMGSNTSKTISIPSGTKYIRTIIKASALDTYMVESGTIATTYEPYTSQEADIDLDTIEYCKIGNYEDEFIRTSGKNLFDKDNANILNNTLLNGTNGTISTFNGCKSLYIPIESSTTYTISKILSARFIVGTCSSTPATNVVCDVYSGNNTATSITITSGANDKYLVVFYYLSGTDTLTDTAIINSIMINEGSTALPYEPYGNGEWYIKKNIGKVVLDGSENWTYYAPALVFFTDAYNDLFATGVQQSSDIYSNYYIAGTYGTTNNSILINDIGRIHLRNDDLTSIAELKTWLNTHNTKVVVRRNVVYTPITGTLAEQLEYVYQMLKSYKGQTNISQVNDDLPFELDVSALEDLE